MFRLVSPLAFATAMTLAAGPTLAADFNTDDFGTDSNLRSGFSDDWANSDAGNPLSYQLGTRYWYSWGAQSFDLGTGSSPLTDNSTAQSVEAFARIDDASTGYYAKALAGLSYTTGGTYSGLDSGTIAGGRIGYAGADLGYAWVGNSKSNFSFGPFAGYMYWNDSPNASSNNAANNYTTATSASDISYDPATGQTFWPGDSTPNKVEVNMLRLGVSGQAKFGMFDFSGEVAAVPYANLQGLLGSAAAAADYWQLPPGSASNFVGSSPGYNVADIQSSPTHVDGWGYGAMVEGLVGFHPTNNMTLRVGGRAWYLQGVADTTFSRASIGNPIDANSDGTFDTAPSFNNAWYISRNNPWSLFRYGALAEFSYQF